MPNILPYRDAASCQLNLAQFDSICVHVILLCMLCSFEGSLFSFALLAWKLPYFRLINYIWHTIWFHLPPCPNEVVVFVEGQMYVYNRVPGGCCRAAKQMGCRGCILCICFEPGQSS